MKRRQFLAAVAVAPVAALAAKVLPVEDFGTIAVDLGREMETAFMAVASASASEPYYIVAGWYDLCATSCDVWMKPLRREQYEKENAWNLHEETDDPQLRLERADAEAGVWYADFDRVAVEG